MGPDRLLSLQGNKVAFKRSTVISALEVELEGAWESSPGLPALRQCPDTRPFPVVVDKGAADILGDEIDLYTETGDPITFAVFRTDQDGKKTRTKQAEARALTTRIESEEDEQR